MANNDTPRNWPDLAIGLYDRLNERNAEIVYEFENFELSVPAEANGSPQHAPWKLNGKLKITTSNGVSQ